MITRFIALYKIDKFKEISEDLWYQKLKQDSENVLVLLISRRNLDDAIAYAGITDEEACEFSDIHEIIMENLSNVCIDLTVGFLIKKDIIENSDFKLLPLLLKFEKIEQCKKDEQGDYFVEDEDDERYTLSKNVDISFKTEGDYIACNIYGIYSDDPFYVYFYDNVILEIKDKADPESYLICHYDGEGFEYLTNSVYPEVKGELSKNIDLDELDIDIFPASCVTATLGDSEIIINATEILIDGYTAELEKTKKSVDFDEL